MSDYNQLETIKELLYEDAVIFHNAVQQATASYIKALKSTLEFKTTEGIISAKEQKAIVDTINELRVTCDESIASDFDELKDIAKAGCILSVAAYVRTAIDHANGEHLHPLDTLGHCSIAIDVGRDALVGSELHDV